MTRRIISTLGGTLKFGRRRREAARSYQGGQLPKLQAIHFLTSLRIELPSTIECIQILPVSDQKLVGLLILPNPFDLYFSLHLAGIYSTISQ